MKRATLAAGAKPRKCAVCRQPFMPRNSMNKACGPSCALTLARQVREKAERKQAREQKAKLKTRRELLSEVQQAFNAWVRERDYRQPCISCGIEHAKWDAGHYRSVAAAPELRFHPLNVHKQCAQCNTHKSGNVVEYRIRLVRRIGQANVEWLEGPHEPAKWTVDELERLKMFYRVATRELRKSRDGQA